jgi:SAM-dependent methyltransferase
MGRRKAAGVTEGTGGETMNRKYMNKRDKIPSPMDVDHLNLIREDVNKLMKSAAVYALNVKNLMKIADVSCGPVRLLDIAPQDHPGARPFFPDFVEVDTLDIDPKSGATYIGDICKCPFLPYYFYDFVVCTEVLEHTLRPWDAVKEIHRILKPHGILFLSVPFNLRIHGPLPDCWRFTEYALRDMLEVAGFSIIRLDELETPDRPLMPIHYTVIAEKG